MKKGFRQGRRSYFMALGRRRSAALGRYLNLAPMMDIMFNLLIFFLVATTFQMPEGVFLARLPRHVGLGGQLSVPMVPIRVLLQERQARTAIYLSFSISLREQFEGTPMADYEELYTCLADLRTREGFDRDSPVVLAAQDQVDWQQLIEAYNSAVRAGFAKMGNNPKLGKHS